MCKRRREGGREGALEAGQEARDQIRRLVLGAVELIQVAALRRAVEGAAVVAERAAVVVLQAERAVAVAAPAAAPAPVRVDLSATILAIGNMQPSCQRVVATLTLMIRQSRCSSPTSAEPSVGPQT